MRFVTNGRNVLDTAKSWTLIERHRTAELATKSAMRLNGLCLHCGKPLSDCEFERDPAFGTDYDGSETND